MIEDKKKFCKNQLVYYNNRISLIVETYELEEKYRKAAKVNVLDFAMILLDKDLVKVTFSRLKHL